METIIIKIINFFQSLTDKKIDRIIGVAAIALDTICYLGITITVVLFAWYYVTTDKQIRFYKHAQLIKNDKELICKPLILNNEHLLYACSEK